MQQMVDAVAASVQVPKCMAYIAVLGIMSVAVSGKYKVQIHGSRFEQLVLYLLMIAPPSEGKSPVISLVRKVLNRYEAEYNERIKPDVILSQSKYKALLARQEYLEKQAQKGEIQEAAMEENAHDLAEFKPVTPLRLVGGDITMEAAESIMAEDRYNRFAIISGEGGPLMNIKGRYKQGSSDIDFFLSSHTGETLTFDRIMRGHQFILCPALNMLLAGQPILLQGIMDDQEFAGRGLLARLLYVVVDESISKVGTRKLYTSSIPDYVLSAYESKITKILDYTPEETQILHISKGAMSTLELFHDYIEKQIPDDLHVIGEWCGKLVSATIRISGILHCFSSENPSQHEISDKVMQQAVNLALHFLNHAKAAYGLMGSDPKISAAKYVLKKLDGVKQITKRDLHQLCRGRFKKMDELEPVIALLLDHNYFREMTPPSTGAGRKSSPILYINPIKN